MNKMQLLILKQKRPSERRIEGALRKKSVRIDEDPYDFSSTKILKVQRSGLPTSIAKPLQPKDHDVRS